MEKEEGSEDPDKTTIGENLLASLTEDEIKEKIAQLRKICDADKDVNFALGWCYETGKIDIRECMSLADRRMYEDKEEYYKKYPEKKYR